MVKKTILAALFFVLVTGLFSLFSAPALAQQYRTQAGKCAAAARSSCCGAHRRPRGITPAQTLPCWWSPYLDEAAVGSARHSFALLCRACNADKALDEDIPAQLQRRHDHLQREHDLWSGMRQQAHMECA